MAQSIGELKISIILEILNAEAQAGKVTTSLGKLESQAKKTKGEVSKFDSAAKELSQSLPLVGLGIAGIATGLFTLGVASVKAGAEFQELRDTFQGAESDLELFRQATARTVSDSGLIKLSNYATDLGVALGDQALLFSLAEESADKYGGGVETNFERVINASDGSAKGLRSVGIATKDFAAEIDAVEKKLGQKLETMDADAQMNIRLQAIYKLTGTTIDSVKNKTQSNADVLAELNNVWEIFTQNLGIAVIEGAEFDKQYGGITQTVKESASALGDFISAGIKLAKWIQGASDWIYPWVGAFKTLVDWTQLAIDKIDELTSKQESARGAVPTFDTGADDTDQIQVDEFGRPILPSQENAERSRYKNSKGPIGYQDSTDGGKTGATTKSVKELIPYLQQLQEELDKVNEKIGFQSSIESEAEGLFIKKKDLEIAISYVQEIENIKRLTAEVADIANSARKPIEGISQERIDEIDFDIATKKKKNKDGSFQDQLNQALGVAQNIASILGFGADSFVGKLLNGVNDFTNLLSNGLSLLSLIIGGPAGAGLFSILGLASGGSVPGTGSGDTVPAMLTPGEFVINKSRAGQLGTHFLNFLNGGGSVQSIAPGAFANIGGTSQIVEVPYVVSTKLTGEDIELSFRRRSRIINPRMGRS